MLNKHVLTVALIDVGLLYLVAVDGVVVVAGVFSLTLNAWLIRDEALVHWAAADDPDAPTDGWSSLSDTQGARVV